MYSTERLRHIFQEVLVVTSTVHQAFATYSSLRSKRFRLVSE